MDYEDYQRPDGTEKPTEPITKQTGLTRKTDGKKQKGLTDEEIIEIATKVGFDINEDGVKQIRENVKKLNKTNVKKYLDSIEWKWMLEIICKIW